MYEIMCFDEYGNSIENFVQWDTNRVMYIDWKHNCTPIFQFGNTKSDRLLVVKGKIIENEIKNIAKVNIPNILLQQPSPIIGFVYLEDEVDGNENYYSGKTVYNFKIPVRAKAKPEDYKYAENTEYISWINLESEARAYLAELEGFKDEYEYVLGTAKENANKAVQAAEEAKTSKGNAKDSENKARIFEVSAKAYQDAAKTSKDNAHDSEVAAKASEEAAKASELSANAYKEDAKISEVNTKVSEVKAKESEENATRSEQKAKESETNAKRSEDNVRVSEANVKISETNAKTSEIAAKASEVASKSSEQNAKASEEAATTAVTNIEFYLRNAMNNAALAKSYAMGETGVRIGEDIDNAKYYYLQTKAINNDLNIMLSQIMERIVALENQYPQLIFMSDDGKTELGRQVVYDGGDGVDPIANGIMSTPTKASTEQYFYVFAGWSDAIGGSVSSDVFNNVVADRYVYAVFTEWELENDAWADVKYHIDQGDYATFYSVGDIVPLNVGDETINMEIVAFDHDNLADGSGKAHISFVAKDLLAESKVMNNSEKTDGNGNSGYNIGGWELSDMRLYCNNTIFPRISESVRNMIKSVNKVSDGGYYNKVLVTTSDKIWIPSYHEVGLGGSSYIVNGQGTTYPHFVNTSSRMKNKVDSIVDAWWLRSSYTNNKNIFWGVNSSGTAVTSGSSIANGIAIGFCI